MSNYIDDVVYDSAYSVKVESGKGALYLSKHLLDGQTTGATSTLCYGVQWDAMLDFIKDKEHNVKNSKNWGNYGDTVWTITRTNAKYCDLEELEWIDIPKEGLSQEEPLWVEDEEFEDFSHFEYDAMLLTTGASDSFAVKNIFDVAGNCEEWTNERFAAASRVPRGGYARNDR